MMKSVAVFGAGIAGLSAAHEFARLGYHVSVYEANSDAGGFFRSARRAEAGNMPSEYSWHGMGPWYYNAFDLMKQIPFDDAGSVFERALSRPIDFGIAPDQGVAQFDDSWILPVSKMFRMSGFESARWGWLMLKTWSASRRSVEHYSRLNAAEQWMRRLSDVAGKTWRASFGPWIGSDWTNVSLHTAGHFYRKLLITKPSHTHPADGEGPEWRHGARDGWLLLRGPSSEYWFDRWVDHLRGVDVQFHWNQPLQMFDYDGEQVVAAHLESGRAVRADIYVLATNPFAARDILSRTPTLAVKEQLCLFGPLTEDGPHTQVSFRIAFSKRIAWPRPRAAIVVADSEFNLTLFPQEQAWAPEVDLGDGVQSLWTGTACVATVPGRRHHLPLVQCTREQFIDEVLAQLRDCGGLDRLIRAANGGRSWTEFPILRVEVWHEWLFSPAGIRPHQPKWVTTTNTQRYLPTQATPVQNLVLAGAHTRTQADVWSIEGAVESGRRAAQVIEPGVNVIPQYQPLWMRAIAAVDDLCFSAGLPHVLDLGFASLLAALTAIIVYSVVVWP